MIVHQERVGSDTEAPAAQRMPHEKPAQNALNTLALMPDARFVGRMVTLTVVAQQG